MAASRLPCSSNPMEFLKEVLKTFCALYILQSSVMAQNSTLPTESKMGSQCFREQGMSFVSLYCGYQRVIEVKRAFHGGHAKTAASDCMYVEEDCTEDVMKMYDWDKCNGKHSCVQLMKRAKVPTCGGGDGYLQVDYLCVPGKEKKPTTAPPLTTTEKKAEEASTKSTVKKPPKQNNATVPGYTLDICSNRTLALSTNLVVTSPHYPSSIPGQLDCKCDILARKGSRIHAVVKEISLGNHNGLCHDWLAIMTPGYPEDQVILCGQMTNSGKAVLSKNNKLTMHFHTAMGTHPVNLKGFKLQLTESKHNDLKIRCYETLPLKRTTNGKAAMVLKPTDIKSLPFVSDLPQTAENKNMSTTIHSWTYLVVVTLGMCLHNIFSL